MGFINDTREQAKKALTPKLNWKKAGEDAIDVFKRKKKPTVIMNGTGTSEFALRYRNLRFTTFSSILFFAIAILTIPFASTYKDLTFSLIASILFGMFYFRYAFILWVCRTGWLKGGGLNDTIIATGGDFLRAICADPSALLPLPLAEKQSQEKGASK